MDWPYQEHICTLHKTWGTKQQGCLNGGIGSGRVQKLLIYFATLWIITKSFGHMENSSSPHILTLFWSSFQIIHIVNNFKSSYWESQDRAEVNLDRIAARYVVTVISKKDVGITWQFPHCNYTVGPYGSGPTANYIVSTCT